MLRLWLASGQTLTAHGYAGHDDRLYLNLAQHIADGHWLGRFDNLTLVKGPFYPMWIAASFIVGVPLQLSQNLLYIAACVVTILALRPVVRSSEVLVAIYAVLVFNPAMFGITRILREGVYIPLTLLLAACLIGLFLRRTSSLRSLAMWAGGAGFALSGMWLARGESIWILPPVLFILAAAAFWLWRSRVDRLWWRCLLLVSPLAVLGAATALVSTINLFSYGIFVVTEVAGPDWLAAYGALSRVEHDPWQRYVVVPRHVRERIYRVSPAFAELQPAIEGELGRGWMSHGCKMMPETCGDITAGWFMFLLRDAASGAGYYRSAPIAVGYYRRLADEVNAACDSGTLRCGPARATMAPRWRREYGPLLLDSMVRAATQVVRFQRISAVSSPSVGDEPTLLPFRLVSRDRLAPSADAARLRVNGWGFSPNRDLLITVQDSARTPFTVDLRRFASQDVFDFFVATEGRQFDRARDARFTLSTPCVRDCSLVIRARGADRVLGTLPLDGGVRGLATPEIRFHIESITKENGRVGFRMYGVDSVKLRILTGFIWLYGRVAPILTGILIITLVAAPIAVVFSYRSPLLVPMLTLVGAVIGRIVLIAVIDSTSWRSINPLYLGPVHALLLLAGLLACVEMGSVGSVWVRLAARWPRRAERVGPVQTDRSEDTRVDLKPMITFPG